MLPAERDDIGVAVNILPSAAADVVCDMNPAKCETHTPVYTYTILGMLILAFG